MFGQLEEDQYANSPMDPMGQIAPQVQSPAPLNPVVAEYLKPKLKKPEPQGSMPIEAPMPEQTEQSGGFDWQSGIAGLGQAIAGKDPSNVIKQIKQQRIVDEERAGDSDPTSPQSVLAQQLAKKMLPSMKTEGMSAMQINKLLPGLSKLSDIEGRRLDRQSEMDFRNRTLGMEKEKLDRTLNNPAAQFDRLPKENQVTVSKLADSNANKTAIVNQIDAVMGQWENLDDEQKLQQGRQLIKTLNSTQGADAVGAEEAARLAGKLDFALGNITNSNPTQFGRDLEGFKADAEITSQGIKKSMEANKAAIDKAYGREPQAPKEETKVINGATYKKVPGGWQKVK